jgi:hypothetical protein
MTRDDQNPKGLLLLRRQIVGTQSAQRATLMTPLLPRWSLAMDQLFA